VGFVKIDGFVKAVRFVKIGEFFYRRKDIHDLLRGLNECVPAISKFVAPFMVN
jgi:hypothetical protein